MIQNIIFDWSGVVKDCVLDQLIIVNKIFKEFGVTPITLEEFQENWRQPYMVFYNKYLPELTLEVETAAYKKYLTESPKAKEYPGMGDLIRKLKKEGKKIFVLSSDHADTIFLEMESFGLKDIFDDMVIDVHDKEEGIHAILQRNNLDSKHTIFIGDSNHEIEVGKKAGVQTIAVTWGFSSEKALRAKQPDFVVHSVKELEEIL